MRCKRLVSLSLPLLLVIACADGGSPTEQATANPETEPGTSAGVPTEESESPDAHNSRNSLDWAGSYSGVLPCTSCPGIDTLITLHEDGTFERSLLYIDEAPVPETDSGTFTWSDSGGAITLNAGDGDAQQYQVGENALIQLDRNGERFTGDLASQYVLQKHVHDPGIEDKRWKLVELRGTPVASGQDARVAILTLRAVDSVASGNASCNSFSGTYAIKSGQRISFGRNMAVTMMACPDMSIESAFLEALGQADNYTVSDEGMLSLNRARMAPLARFEPDMER